MAFNAYAAKNALVRVGAGPTTLTAKKWTVTPKAEPLDTSNFEGAGYEENITGLRGNSFTIEMDDNGALSYFDAGLTAGAFVVNLKLYLNGISGPYWLFPSAWIESPAMNADVKSSMGLTVTGKGSGTFSYPTGTAGSTT
ncbi:MAG TPA: hypothetical protein VNT76_19690 [Candidatus Binatus sp.]|nr:hypothetical protein [Candidatus Binatus sp.]